MLRKSFLLLLLIILSAPIFAQDQLQVLVLDETGEQLPGIPVAMYDKSGKSLSTSMTDEKGVASIDVVDYPATVLIEDLQFDTDAKTVYSKPAGKIVMNAKKKLSGINEVIVTGVGRPTRLDDAVSTYRIITAADIKAMGAVTLNDALRNQLGVNVSQDASLGSQVSMRGLSGNNIKFLIDGLPVNGREGSNVDLSQLNLANIERIEMVQGPMNIMYGSDAIGGVYNLITKTNSKSKSIGANAYYESIGRYNFGVDGAKSWGKHNLTLMGTRNFSQGWDPIYDTVRNPLWKPKEQYIGNMKYTYRFNDFASMTLGMDLTSEKLISKGGMDEYRDYNLGTKDAYFNTTRWANRLQFKWRRGNNGYWESNNSYSLYNRKRTTYITDLSTLERELSTDEGDQTVNSFDNFASRTTYNNKTGKLNYTFGYDVNLEFAQGVDKIKDGSKFIGDYALFLTTDIKIFDDLTVQPAVRFIHNTVYNAPVSPSFAALYKPSKKLQIRGAYSRGFRAPTLKEMYLTFFDVNHAIVGNEDLKAEYSNQFQLATAFTAYEKGNRTFITSLTAFYDNVKNQIALGTAPQYLIDQYENENLYIYSNIGHIRMLTLQWNNEFIYDDLTLKSGLQFTNSFETFSESSLTPNFNYIEVNGSARYSISPWEAGISIFYKYTGGQPQVGSIMGGNLFSDTKLRDFHILDASIDKSLWKDRLQLTVGVRNLLNNVNVGFAGGSGAVGGGHSSNGMLLTTGRSLFTSLRFQLSK